MAFDVDAFRAAHRPWVFTVGRRAFTARFVSAPQVLRYQDRLSEGATDPRKFHAAVRQLLRCAFPWRCSYLVRGDPVRIVMALEPAARAAALADFFVALYGGPTPTRPSATSGTSSPTTMSPPT